jgi:hypothetical protein
VLTQRRRPRAHPPPCQGTGTTGRGGGGQGGAQRFTAARVGFVFTGPNSWSTVPLPSYAEGPAPAVPGAAGGPPPPAAGAAGAAGAAAQAAAAASPMWRGGGAAGGLPVASSPAPAPPQQLVYITAPPPGTRAGGAAQYGAPPTHAAQLLPGTQMGGPMACALLSSSGSTGSAGLVTPDVSGPTPLSGPAFMSDGGAAAYWPGALPSGAMLPGALLPGSFPPGALPPASAAALLGLQYAPAPLAGGPAPLPQQAAPQLLLPGQQGGGFVVFPAQQVAGAMPLQPAGYPQAPLQLQPPSSGP